MPTVLSFYIKVVDTELSLLVNVCFSRKFYLIPFFAALNLVSKLAYYTTSEHFTSPICPCKCRGENFSMVFGSSQSLWKRSSSISRFFFLHLFYCKTLLCTSISLFVYLSNQPKKFAVCLWVGKHSLFYCLHVVSFCSCPIKLCLFFDLFLNFYFSFFLFSLHQEKQTF